MNTRFDRQLRIPGWNQDRLHQARVVVVGVGAIGNEVCGVLTLAGIRRFILCDPDFVEESNLSRTRLFRPNDVGRAKVFAAAERIGEMAPDTIVEARHATLMHGVGLGELRDASVVLSCLDSRAARLQLARRCGLVRARWIDGGTGPWSGEVRPFLDPDGPCYGCLFGPAERAEPDHRASCAHFADIPVASAAPAAVLVGTWMANHALRHIMGLPVLAAIQLIDLERSDSVLVTMARDLQCPFHEPLPIPRQVPVAPQQTIGDLLAHVPPSATAQLWSPVVSEFHCLRCHGRRHEISVSPPASCPHCGGALRFRRTTDLRALPASTQLGQVGLAHQEIIPTFASDDSLDCVELLGHDQSSAAHLGV